MRGASALEPLSGTGAAGRVGLPKTAPCGTSLWRFCSAIHGSAHFWKPYPTSRSYEIGVQITLPANTPTLPNLRTVGC